MAARPTRTLIAAALMAGLLAACQAPGFMGLNGESTIPGLGLDSYTLARVPIRVLLPTELASERRSGDRPEVPVEGARVYLALDPTVAAKTDSEGIAPLTIPVNGIQLIRADVRTSAGTMVLEGMMGLPFSREREKTGGPNTVLLPSMRELNEPLTLSLASTLVAAHLQERYTPEQIRYLNPLHVLSTTREVAQVMKAGGYRTAAVPDLTDRLSVQEAARELVNRHAKVQDAFRLIFAARVPELIATPSAMASALPLATSSLAASESAALATVGNELFPIEVGTTTYALLDEQDQLLGSIARSITKVSQKKDGTLAFGRIVTHDAGKRKTTRFLLKLQAHQLKLSQPFRPEMTYPLPLQDGAEWSPAPGLQATARHVPDTEESPATWLITIEGQLKGEPVRWIERYQPQVGLVEFSWGNAPDSPVARLLPAADETH